VAGGDLNSRIEALGSARLLGEPDVARLHKLRFLGNRAAHEADAPTTDELRRQWISQNIYFKVFMYFQEQAIACQDGEL
jgi:hypothetical protein